MRLRFGAAEGSGARARLAAEEKCQASVKGRVDPVEASMNADHSSRNMSLPVERPHPNDPDTVRRKLERDALLMTAEERDEVRTLIDAALARLPMPESATAMNS
jgi:hypothetical protein